MGINILIVDDSAVMRSMIKKTIVQSKVDVEVFHEASNGKEGLDILEKNGFDLAFIDVNMPVMDGIDMLENIRKNPDTQHLPVLIVSTESNEKRIKTFNKHNAGFVHKPFTPEKLREQILSILGAQH